MSDGGVDFQRLYARLEAAERALDDTAAASDAHREAVLRMRAETLARAREEAAVDAVTVMAFRLGTARYGVPFEALDQVVECTGLCPLPGAPRAVLGALATRGGIVPVLDLGVLLGTAAAGLDDLQLVLVVMVGDERFGLAVEDTEGALDLERRQLRAPGPGPFTAMHADGLLVLDVANLTVPA